MTLFNDLYKQSKFSILSEAKTDNGIMKVFVPFTQTDQENANGRIYPRALMQREVDRVSLDIADGRMLGTADHPKSGNTELDTVSHLVTKMELDKDGRGWATLKIMDTTAGKNLKTILKSGAKLGISTRGFGTQNPDTKKVNDDYKLTGLDIVANPSYRDGFFSSDNIFESLDLTGKKASLGSSRAHSKEGIVKKKMAETVNKVRAKPGLTERRIAMRKRILLSSGDSRTTEQIDEMTEKLLAAESKICADRKLVEAKERLEESQKNKKDRRLGIRQELNRWGVLAGFTREQIDVAIQKKMSELNEEEGK